MMKLKKKQKGMTFLELMVAVSVLIVGISGTIGLIHRTIASASMVASQLKAAYLAQEGIEVVRNIRDSSWVRDAVWLENLGGCTVCCQAAFNHDGNTRMMDCPAEGPEPLRRAIPYGFYGYGVGEESMFRRKIRTERIDGFLRVEATVFWYERGQRRNVTVVENLYDWR